MRDSHRARDLMRKITDADDLDTLKYTPEFSLLCAHIEKEAQTLIRSLNADPAGCEDMWHNLLSEIGDLCAATVYSTEHYNSLEDAQKKLLELGCSPNIRHVWSVIR